MSKVLLDHFSIQNVDFRRFWRGHPKFGYMVSLQFSAATWLINSKTLLKTSTISPWAKTQIFTYRYHLGGQNLVMFFMYTYAQCII